MNSQMRSLSSVSTIAVVVVHYGPFEVVRPLLEDLGRQRDVAVDLHLVDNSPVSHAAELCLQKCPPLTYVHLPHNPGFGSACNFAASKVDAEYIYFINPDVRLHSDLALARLLDRYRVAGGRGIASPLLEQRPGVPDRACARNIPSTRSVIAHMLGLSNSDYQIELDSDSDDLVAVGAVNGAFMITNVSDFRDLGGFDERFWMYAEDLDLCLRYVQAGLPVYVDLGTVVEHAKAGTTGGRRSLRLRWKFYLAILQFGMKQLRRSTGVEGREERGLDSCQIESAM